MPKFSFTLNRRILGLKPPSKRDFSAKTSRITRMSTSRETLYFLNFSRMSCEVAMSWNRPIAGLWWQQSIWMPRQPCRSRRKLVLADLPLPAGNSTYCLLPTRTCLRMCSRMMSSTPGALASFGVTGRCFHHSGDGMNAMVVDVVVVVVVVLGGGGLATGLGAAAAGFVGGAATGCLGCSGFFTPVIHSAATRPSMYGSHSFRGNCNFFLPHFLDSSRMRCSVQCFRSA
mmetsp:Transcript_5783/g.17206  ORF Transcript_5783/g.17206 Transcript_5783/m.17206 type:complete len:229 (+) Transcript_5783:1216-1902(+)